VRRWLLTPFTLDERSLAAARIGLALLVLADLAWRTVDLEAHYTDAGVLPRAAFALEDWDALWSVHVLSGGAWLPGVLFALQAGLAVALLVGRWTRLATIGIWLLLTSLHARNPLLRDGQDDLLRVMMFWFIFLPWGARFSLDRARGWEVAAGPVCFILQICLIYGSSVVAKLISPWWQEGNGVLYSLSLGRYETWLGQRLVESPALLRMANPAVIALELALPLLLLLPVRAPWIRLAAVGGAWLLHLGFALGMRLGSFPFIAMALWLALLPGAVWERLGVRASPSEPRPSAPGTVGVFAAACLILVFLYNLAYLEASGRFPRWIGTASDALGLQQWWGVFAPPPGQRITDGWFVIPATLEDGEQVDLFAPDSRLTWERPERVSATYPNTRWRHYLANAILNWPRGSGRHRTLQESRVAYARLLCKGWNEEHPPGKRVVSANLYFLSHPVGPARRPVQRIHLLAHTCGGSP
jgi:hypothetical protein